MGRRPHLTTSGKGPEAKELVRRGYDAASRHYRADDETPEVYRRWLAELARRLPPRSSVLDLGCGCGVPVALHLARAGHRVTGVDLSGVQVERARRLVPGATFLCRDLSTVGFPDGAFDAVVFLYAVIHLPLDEQPEVFRRVARWLRPGGWLLLTAGHRAGTGEEQDWLGSGAPMWWSHTDAAGYRGWLREAGLAVVEEGFVPEGDGGHSLFWARRQAN